MSMIQKLVMIPLCIFLFTQCAGTPTPIRKENIQAIHSTKHKKLMIILPGRGDSDKSLVKAGFVSVLHEHYPEFDATVVNAHLGYYRKRIIEQRLLEDVINPAIEKGYQEIWMMGISLGGAGSIKMFEKHHDKIAGIILISPYLGSKGFHKVLNAQLASDSTSSIDSYAKKENDFYTLWRWIMNNESLMRSNRIWLAYGEQDYLDGHESLKTFLDPENTLVLPGKHKIGVFKDLWSEILKRKPFG